ncbi:helix-turn-helix domain-containing protein [Iamia sp.]|uniref:helix-turn-helix domain-containing protein n=1 Tax=Iamia sp. TaxID=2722710 RepID=UPI002CA24280|nr:helix-turn-helix domain-containing protein [Iamia sp.]HXH56275.1 helix-turn-helix domain-containing protein [Iamia sp.]
MKPDTPAGSPLDRVERAHLRDPADRSHVIYRYDAPTDLCSLVQRFWIPVWSVPPGHEAPQQVLQYPVALVVITADYARFYGVVPGLSTTTLTGEGWAVGVMFQPAAGALLAGTTMADWTDRFADLTEVIGETGARLTWAVRRAMATRPDAEASHRSAMSAYAEVLRGYLPVNEQGILVNAIVAFVEGRPDVTRVTQVADKFGLTERALQRLTRRRLGLTPKWLIQRRRLHEAAERLRAGGGDLAAVAADLGYADQPHFTHDFHAVTGMTPGGFAARFAASPCDRDRATARS